MFPLNTGERHSYSVTGGYYEGNKEWTEVEGFRKCHICNGAALTHHLA
jgi:hypothetical protein